MGTGVGEGRPGRWIEARDRFRQVVCIGDSTTLGVIDESTGEPSESWVDLVAAGLRGNGAVGTGGPHAEGFRGQWRGREWSRSGAWTKTAASDPFDVVPFGYGYVSSGVTEDEATWTRPAGPPVLAFDLYGMAVPGLGAWQYRVDDGPWRNVEVPSPTPSTLVRWSIDQPVHERVRIRGFDGTAPCVAAIAGISVHGPELEVGPGVRLHHLGVGMKTLALFTRRSDGDPLALLDDIRPELVIVAFSNDVLWAAPSLYEASLHHLVDRVESYADVLLVNAFEQRPPRRVRDAVTALGSHRIVSATAAFVPSDVSLVVRGTNIPADPDTTITSVESAREAALSAAATGDGHDGELVIGQGREVEMQAAYRESTRRVAAVRGCRILDVHEMWSEVGVTGWDATVAADLVVDRYHASARGHDEIAERVLHLLALDPPAPAPDGPGSTGPTAVTTSVASSLPEVVPGTASVAAPDSGPVQLHVPVELSSPSASTVTVEWRTRVVDEAEFVQAPRADYVSASGSVTFAPGQTAASVAITVIANSTGEDERIVVSFTDPTNATVGGFWGLGFAIVTARTGADRSEGSADRPSTS